MDELDGEEGLRNLADLHQRPQSPMREVRPWPWHRPPPVPAPGQERAGFVAALAKPESGGQQIRPREGIGSGVCDRTLPSLKIDDWSVLAREEDEPLRVDVFCRVTKEPKRRVHHRPVTPLDSSSLHHMERLGRSATPRAVGGTGIVMDDNMGTGAQLENTVGHFLDEA